MVLMTEMKSQGPWWLVYVTTEVKGSIPGPALAGLALDETHPDTNTHHIIYINAFDTRVIHVPKCGSSPVSSKSANCSSPNTLTSFR